MTSLRTYTLSSLLLTVVWSFSVQSRETVRMARSRVNAYVVQDGVTHRVCQGMDTSITGVVLTEGRNFYAVKFNNGPCAGRWAWVAKRDIAGTSSETEARVCENCQGDSVVDSIRDQISTITGSVGANYIPVPARSCSQFVQANGQLGDYGQRTLAAIRAVDPSGQCFLGGGITWSSHVCPGYKNFTTRERERFWVYAFGAIAHDESNCNPNVSGDGGASDGLFQMEYSNWKRRYRSAKFCYPRTPINTRALKFQFECTASIMRDINCGRSNRPLGNGNGNTIFWSQLQSTNGDISRMIKRYPGCL